MVITKNNNVDMLRHLLDAVITSVGDGKQYQLIQQFLTSYGTTNYSEFMDMGEEDFVKPPYKICPTGWKIGDTNPPEAILNPMMAKKLRNLHRWLYHLQSEQAVLMVEADIIALTMADFQKHNILDAARLRLIHLNVYLLQLMSSDEPRVPDRRLGHPYLCHVS